MKINKAIKAIMWEKRLTNATLGKALHKVDKVTGEVIPLKATDVSARLMNDNLTFDKAVEMVSALGYEIVLQEKKPRARRADQIVIDQRDVDMDLDALLSDEDGSAPVAEETAPEKSGWRIPLV